MTGNPRARNFGQTAPLRPSSVSGARPIPPSSPVTPSLIDVEETWLEADDLLLDSRPAPSLNPTAGAETANLLELDRVLRDHQIELASLREEAARRIEAALRERDAALAEVEVLRASLRPGGASMPPELALPRVVQPPPLAPPTEPTSIPSPTPPALPPLASAAPAQPRAREPGSVPTLSEVIVATDPLGHDLGATDPDERRSEPRIQRQFELEFNYETHFFAGLTLDISSGGLFIATYHLLPVGTALSLSFQLPDGVRLSVRGEVRWVRCASEGNERPGMGVAFKELSADALEAISAFCAERPPLYIDL